MTIKLYTVLMLILAFIIIAKAVKEHRALSKLRQDIMLGRSEIEMLRQSTTDSRTAGLGQEQVTQMNVLRNEFRSIIGSAGPVLRETLAQREERQLAEIRQRTQLDQAQNRSWRLGENSPSFQTELIPRTSVFDRVLPGPSMADMLMAQSIMPANKSILFSPEQVEARKLKAWYEPVKYTPVICEEGSIEDIVNKVRK